MTRTEHPVFAALYDPLTRLVDHRLRPHREWLVEGLSGRVLDLGAETGATSPYLCGRGLAFHAIEPDPHIADRPDGATSTSAVRSSSARDAPSRCYPDGFFDAVVVSLVLCSVESVETSVDEIARVLKPGGECRFLEHVRAEDWQRASRRR